MDGYFIIPFKINKEEFIDKYCAFVKKKILAPKEFKNNEMLEDIKVTVSIYRILEYVNKYTKKRHMSFLYY